MLKNTISFVLVCILLVSCSGSKKGGEQLVSKLEGTWELNFITGPRIAFEGLYPDRKPVIVFDIKEKRVSGNTGCNSYSGTLDVQGDTIDFTAPMAMTKMMCHESQQGESTFMNTLPKITKYKISEDGKTLTFISNDVEMMRFTKK